MTKEVPENLEEMMALGKEIGYDLACYDDYDVMLIAAEKVMADELVKWVVARFGESAHNLMGYSFFETEEAAKAFILGKVEGFKNDDPDSFLGCEDDESKLEEAGSAFCLTWLGRKLWLENMILVPYDVDRDGMNNVLRNWKYEISMEDGLIGPWKWVDADGNLKAEGVGRVAFFEAAVNAEKKDNGVYFIFGDTGAPDGARYSDKAGNYYTRDGERIVG